MGWFWRKRNKKLILERGAMVLKDLIEFGHGKSNPIKFFSADEILKATNNFSSSNCVSISDYYNDWYSGKNENHPMILIKKFVGIAWFSGLREDLMCRDIAVSSMVSGHKNFLKLVGCCLEFEFPVMVYHGVKKHYRLKISEQTWKRRMKIAEDIATALAYLHTAFPRPFVYRNMYLENILLDEDGVAKLMDFTYCVSIPEGETFVNVVDKAEVFYSYLYDSDNSSGVVSEKTDVFAFGMFMGLTLLLGKQNILDLYLEEEGGGSYTDYVSWKKKRAQNFMSKLKEDRPMEEIADPKMIEKMGQISEQEIHRMLCQMEAFRMLSLRCIGPSEEVPTMVEVAKELKKIQTSLQNDFSFPFPRSISFYL
ncbi:Protein kinase domain [Arabidopsis thaliana x Arabidopsis arenosa]|uniref:Protein kinase domain n=1 Tax=Arabidopsis thaliana x Arabidopsis arenosa TaxID=1240361 RepID=A0A8T2BEY9_9BRAS|nr:Protein kinase domain [Arabidopsis thaliana x Arabidopsis arenosa]